MDIRLILKVIGFLSLEAIGVPSNLIVLASFTHFRFYDGKFLPAEIFLCMLCFNNLVLVLIRGIPQSLDSLGMKNLFDQQGCDIYILVYRSARSMAICMTSLLSCYQWVILVPTSAFWGGIKQRLAQWLLPGILSLWFLNTTIYALTIYSYSWGLSQNSTVYAWNLEFCLFIFPSYSASLFIGTFYVVRDSFWIVLMILSSLCIVVVLYRHRQQVKSIRSPQQNIKNSAESRAAKTVLMLVSTYVIFFGLHNCMWLYTIHADASADHVISDARIFIGSCYSAISPIIIITTNKKVQMKMRTLFSKDLPKSQETTISYITTEADISTKTSEM